ncbi:MAG TPA: RNA 2',3'-cyclic phosphodiesterase, partial [Thermodesulfobacteriota bacterium]|nr:RNA 2',3'-cyclic phosphodiesterase [Thermodesulfobacteriota bacterium]
MTEKLAELQAALDKGFSRVSWVRPANIHLTMKFLGEVEESRIDELSRELEAAARDTRPFTLSAGGVGGFPSLKSPRVLWVGLKG